MSQQHAHFEEESGGEPSDQISSAPRYEVPPWSSDQVEMPDYRLQGIVNLFVGMWLIAEL